MTPVWIAVVEDDEGLRRALVHLLEASGHRVWAFPSAEALLSSDKRRGAACLIFDVRLPGLSGFELQQRLADEGCEAPVIYMTGRDDPLARQRAARQGAAFFLKPFDGKTLLAAIGCALGGSSC
jgi:FixJ family two-component response regulator